MTGDNWMYPKPMYDLSGWQLRSAACGGVTTSIASEFKVRMLACARVCVCSLARFLRVFASARARACESACGWVRVPRGRASRPSAHAGSRIRLHVRAPAHVCPHLRRWSTGARRCTASWASARRRSRAPTRRSSTRSTATPRCRRRAARATRSRSWTRPTRRTSSSSRRSSRCERAKTVARASVRSRRSHARVLTRTRARTHAHKRFRPRTHTRMRTRAHPPRVPARAGVHGARRRGRGAARQARRAQGAQGPQEGRRQEAQGRQEEVNARARQPRALSRAMSAAVRRKARVGKRPCTLPKVQLSYKGTDARCVCECIVTSMLHPTIVLCST